VNESQQNLSDWLDGIIRATQAASAGGSGKDSWMFNKQSRESRDNSIPMG